MSHQVAKYTVSVFGDTYTLVSDEPREHILDVAATVDLLMQEIAQKSNCDDGKRVAVLAALKLAAGLREQQYRLMRIINDELPVDL